MRFSWISFFTTTFVLVSLVQTVAALDGIMAFFHLHWIFAGFAALMLAFIPAIGPLAGMYGAVKVWGWNPLLALMLFFFPYFLFGLMLILGVGGSFWFLNKLKKKLPRDIEPDFTVKETKNADSEETTFFIDYDDGRF